MPSCEMQLQDLEDLAGRDLDGRYVLEQFIDRGSYGAVYRGVDRKFNQQVAIKVGLSSREFMKEARLAAEVKHNSIVQVTDFGSDNGLAYLVMEYLEGDDLEKLFKKQGNRLAPKQLRQLVDEIGDALAAAHSDLLIHRDLKPRNIICRGHANKPGTSKGSRFVLLDFGIAAKLDCEGTQRNRTQDGAGTIEYMAPELLTTEPQATASSDIYAFGVILYQMITGQAPFPQSDASHVALAQCLNAIINTAPPRFEEVGADKLYPKVMQDLVLQCLEKDPQSRPQSMCELRERFLEIFDGSPEWPAPRGPRESRETFRPTQTDSNLFVRRPPLQRKVSWSVRIASRWPWVVYPVAAIAFVALAATFPMLRASNETAYALLTYEYGHIHGKPVDENLSLMLPAGESIRFTFLIEGPVDDVVHFEQPECPEGVDIETVNGPVPHKSKCFIITSTDPHSAEHELPTMVFYARSAHHSQTFEKTLRLSIQRAAN